MLTSSISSQLYYTNHSLQGKNVKFLLLSTLSLILMENTMELAKKSKVWVWCGTSNAAFVPSQFVPSTQGLHSLNENSEFLVAFVSQNTWAGLVDLSSPALPFRNLPSSPSVKHKQPNSLRRARKFVSCHTHLMGVDEMKCDSKLRDYLMVFWG